MRRCGGVLLLVKLTREHLRGSPTPAEHVTPAGQRTWDLD